MSDLISRGVVIKEIWNVFNEYANDNSKFDEFETKAINKAFKVLQNRIETKPIAYDVDKVVEQIEEKMEFLKNYKKYETMMMYEIVGIIEDLIDIIRAGGKE